MNQSFTQTLGEISNDIMNNGTEESNSRELTFEQSLYLYYRSTNNAPTAVLRLSKTFLRALRALEAGVGWVGPSRTGRGD